MLKRITCQGSIYNLSDIQLQQLLNAANYRGLDAVAAALRRERSRRAQGWIQIEKALASG